MTIDYTPVFRLPSANIAVAADIATGTSVDKLCTAKAVADAAIVGGWGSGGITSGAIDTLLGSTQGMIMYRNATTWVALSPGTNGYVLTSGGAAANPSWAAGGGGGSVAASSILTGALASGVGFSAVSYSVGTKSSGTFTPDPTNGNFQHATNGGGHTLAPPSNVCTIVLEYLNNGSAGAVTTSGFTKVTGDSLTTTNTNKFLLQITKTSNYSHLNVVALQ